MRIREGMRTFVKASGLLMVLAALRLLGFGQEPQKTNPPFSIVISAVQDTVSAGAKVKVKAEVTNLSQHPLTATSNCGECNIEVRDANGNSVPETEQHRRVRQLRPTLRRFTIEIMPGETKKWTWVVNDIYEMGQPGRYFVQIGVDLDGTGVVKSNAIAVTVVESRQSELAPAGSQPSFSFEIDALQDIVRAGSEIVLRIETKDIADHALEIDNASTMYSLEVRDGGGALAPMSEAGQRHQDHIGKGGSSRIHLGPGETKGTGSITLSDLYNLAPGHYTVQLSRMDEATKAMVQSNVITLTITP